MAKRFNGQKFSHGLAVRSRTKCPMCSTEMIRFMGVLRCTEMRASKKKGASQRRVIKHGSLITINKRVAQRAALTGAA